MAGWLDEQQLSAMLLSPFFERLGSHLRPVVQPHGLWLAVDLNELPHDPNQAP